MRTDGRTGGDTDMTNLIVALRNFANAPKNDFERIQKETLPYRIRQTNKQTNKQTNCVKIGVV